MTAAYGSHSQSTTFHNRQAKSLMAGILILITGGIKSLEVTFLSKPSYFDKTAWFFASMMGALIAFLLPYKLPNKFIYMFSSIFTVIGGIISASSIQRNSYDASAVFNGVGCGVALLITIREATSDSAHRGRVSSLDLLDSTFGYFFFSVHIYMYFNVSEISTNFRLPQQLGVVTCVLSVLAFTLAFKAIDSPISYLIVSDECGAFQRVMDLNGEHCASIETHKHFEELKSFVIGDRRVPCAQRIWKGIPPFIKLSVVRSFFTLTGTFPLFYMTWTISQVEHSAFAIVIYGACRVAGVMFSQILLLDKLGRKPVLVTSTLVSGGLLIAVGYLIGSPTSMYFILWLLIAVQLFSGLGQVVTSVYMTEAFNPHAKNLFIFLILVLENVTVVACFHYSRFYLIDRRFYYGLGGGLLLSSQIALLMLPETKSLSLKNAHVKFSGFFSIGC